MTESKFEFTLPKGINTLSVFKSQPTPPFSYSYNAIIEMLQTYFAIMRHELDDGEDLSLSIQRMMNQDAIQVRISDGVYYIDAAIDYLTILKMSHNELPNFLKAEMAQCCAMWENLDPSEVDNLDPSEVDYDE